MKNKVFINEEIFDTADAKVSAFDRGYLFSDGVYELIPYFKSKPFLFEAHFSRLKNSLKMVGIDNPYEDAPFKNKIDNFLENCSYDNFYLYIQITRGAPNNLNSEILREHSPTKIYNPTVFMFYSPIKNLIKNSLNSVNAITLEDKRWTQCDIKSISLLYNSYAKTLANKLDAYEAILIRDGYITEGCSSNIFIIKDDVIKTTPKSNLILPGVTREFILEKVIKDSGFKMHEENFGLDELLKADEVFLTNSSQGILVIDKIDQHIIKNNSENKITHKLFNSYKKFLE